MSGVDPGQEFDLSFGGLAVPLNLEGYQEPQDVNDPIWESTLPDPASDPEDPSNMHELGYAEEIRTSSGRLDLGHLVNDFEDWVSQETHADQGHAPIRTRTPEHIIGTHVLAANKMRATTYAVGGTNLENRVRIGAKRPERQRLLISNPSAGILYVSHDTNSAPSGPNVFPIAANGGTLELRTSAEVWAIAAVPGTTQIFGVIEEFFEPESV